MHYKDASQKITVTVEITHRYSYWLSMELIELASIFGFTVTLHNILRTHQFNKLYEILLFSRKGFQERTITEDEFAALDFHEKQEVEELEERWKRKIIGAKPEKMHKFGPVRMKEIDDVLSRLGLKFRGE